MNVMEPNQFYERYIKEDFETEYVPHVFETICKQYLIRLNRRGLLVKKSEELILISLEEMYQISPDLFHSVP